MIATPHILDTEAQDAAVIHLNIARSDMMSIFGPAVAELMAELKSQGIEPVGAVFAHHLKMSPERFDFELGVKIAAPLTPNGRVKQGQLPAAKVARTVYSGPYQGLPSAWGAFEDWIKANGHVSGPSLWEVYSTGPQSSPDPKDWQTELNRILIG